MARVREDLRDTSIGDFYGSSAGFFALDGVLLLGGETIKNLVKNHPNLSMMPRPDFKMNWPFWNGEPMVYYE